MNDCNLDSYTETINQIIGHTMKKIGKESLLKDSMLYSVMSGGKRIRAKLFCLLLEAYKIDYKQYANTITAIEMIHAYSLVHDDLPAMDNDILRRNLPTTHYKYGEANAILCGDALLTDAFLLLANEQLEEEKKIKIITTISLASGSSGMVYGQSLDMDSNAKNIKDLENIYYYKTAMLIQASLACAAIIADVAIDDFVELGSYLGLAFQIQDDILEYTQTTEQIGKSNTSDEENEKETILNFVSLNQAQAMLEIYFEKIEKILEKNIIVNTKLNLLILEIANRDR